MTNRDADERHVSPSFGGFSRLSLVILAAGTLLTAPAEAKFILKIKTNLRTYAVVAHQDKSGKYWVDLLQTAKGLGVSVTVNAKNRDIYYLRLTPTFSMEMDSVESTFAPLDRSKQIRGKAFPLPDPVLFIDGRPLVTLESLPPLFKREFTYHRQRKLLTEVQHRAVTARDEFRSVSVRFQKINQTVWIAVQDLARAVGAVSYSLQARRYNFILPGFRVLELRVEQPWVYVNGRATKRLEDPTLVFSGAPYISLASIEPIFGFTGKWEEDTRTLRVPSSYGFATKTDSRSHPLQYLGYSPQPLRFRVENIQAFYQKPAPSAPSENDQPFDSVRDFLTNTVKDPHTGGLNRVSGNFTSSLSGTFLNAPLDSQGQFEKIGAKSRLESGGITWGFPGLQVKAAREYVNLGNLNNQFQSVDLVSLSRSNDSFNDGGVNPQFTGRLLYGQDRFSVFLSTGVVSRTLDFRQHIAGGQWEWSWTGAEGRKIEGNVTQMAFFNKSQETSQSTLDLDFLNDLLLNEGEDLELLDDFLDDILTEEQAASLRPLVLSRRHGLTLVDATFKKGAWFQGTGTMGLSYFRDEFDSNKWKSDDNWKVRTVLTRGPQRLDMSYESAGKFYRSIGDPQRYDGSRVFRVAPSLEIFKIWKTYGEIRREETAALERVSRPKSRSRYYSNSHVLQFPHSWEKASAVYYDNSLYGSRRTVDLDHNQSFRGDSFSVGLGFGENSDSQGKKFRVSRTYRAGYDFQKEGWNLSLSQDLTRDTDLASGRIDWSSTSDIFATAGRWRGRLKYSIDPGSYSDNNSLYTGFVQAGRDVSDEMSLETFWAASSPRTTLSRPAVWRAGLRFAYQFL